MRVAAFITAIMPEAHTMSTAKGVDRLGDARLERRLARDKLPVPGAQHVAENGEVEVLAPDVCPFERGFHHGRGEVGGFMVFKGAAKTGQWPSARQP